MKFNIMGTAAYERVPAMFCDCKVCKLARTLGGKNIRTQAQTLIDDVMLVDFGQDNYIHFINSKNDFTKIKCILITHSHTDHFIPCDFQMTGASYGHNSIAEKIKIFGNAECKEQISFEKWVKCEFVEVKPYETFEFLNYTITAIPANHGTRDPLCYIINDGKKTLLYNNDSGVFTDDVYEFIKKLDFKFDAVIADCTACLLEGAGGHHMTLSENEAHMEMLKCIGAVNADTKWIITHYSHNALFENEEPVTAERLEEIAKEKNMISAYDGIEIEI